MRKRTHFCEGNGVADFVKTMHGYFPAGKIAVIFQSAADAQKICEALGDSYKLYLFTEKECSGLTLSEEIRFAVGVGTPSVISTVKKCATGRKFAFYAKQIDYRYLYNFDGTKCLPEFVYIDRDFFHAFSSETLSQVYASVFSLWCEGHIRLFEDSYLPYIDKGLVGVLGCAEKILKGECDKDEFFSDGLRALTLLTELFTEKEPLYVTAIADGYGRTPEKQFVSAYFSVNLLRNFTKSSFGVMMNSTDERGRQRTVAFLPDNEKMKSFALRYKAVARLPSVKTEELIAVFNRTEGLPMVDELRERGVFEGLCT